MDSFPEDAANTPVNFYGSALASNEEDNEEELLDVTTEVRHFKWPFARSRAVSTAGVAQRSQENIIPDGAERLEADVQQSAAQIQVFIQSLDNPTKDDLLLKLLSMGRGSLPVSGLRANGNWGRKCLSQETPVHHFI